jgi:hypothetical protein
VLAAAFDVVAHVFGAVADIIDYVGDAVMHVVDRAVGIPSSLRERALSRAGSNQKQNERCS